MRLRSLALAGFLVLTTALGGLAIATLQQSAAEQRAAAAGKAVLIAETIAQRIDAALRFGVPLTQLTGIETLFAQYASHDKDIIEISLRDASGTLLQHSTDSIRLGGITANVDITSGDRAGIRLEVQYAPPSLVKALSEMAGLVISLSVLGGPRTLLPSHVRWLSLATGAGLTSTALALGSSALDILAMAGLLGVAAVCAHTLRTHTRR